MDRTPIKSIFQRVQVRAEKIDFLCRTLPEDLRERRENRDSWHRWNTIWKKAWLGNDLDEEEKKKLREETSVKRKK
jgi:hypothetical protein